MKRTIKKVNLRVDGQLLTLVLDEEFNADLDKVEELPINLAYFIGLQNRIMVALNEARRDKDSHYARQFLIIKDDPLNGRPQSDEWTKQEIEDSEDYQLLRIKYDSHREYYTLISGLIDAYKVKIELLRTLQANRRKELELS
jgi:hypothetical protein